MENLLEIQNPVLPGFNADPNVIRVEDDYYLITSTFNWFPGIPLYHSKDCKNWKLIDHILTRESQLDLKGNPESCGVWAPQISYNEHTKLFYVLFTNMRTLNNTYFDLSNYYVSSESILGPWSEPVYLNSSGFDPSFYHEDGKSWLLNLDWETTTGIGVPKKIIIQEYNFESDQFVGDCKTISMGNPNFGCLEGPHLFKRGDYYYLVVAEGGTGYGHCVRVYRSKNVLGPYEESLQSTVLSSREDPHPKEVQKFDGFLKSYFYNKNAVFQKCGHGSFVETHNGETLLFHLMARPVLPEKKCILNRETSVQLIKWENDWPVLANGTTLPEKSIKVKMEEFDFHDVTESGVIDFSKDSLPFYFYGLRVPIDSSWCSSKRKEGVLSIRGRNSPFSRFDPSIVSRRVQHFDCEIETALSFDCENYRQRAGLIIQCGSETFYSLFISYSEKDESHYVGLSRSLTGTYEDLVKINYESNNCEPVKLKIILRDKKLGFYFNINEKKDFVNIDNYDATVLSDEYTSDGSGAFDGTFAGMICQDIDKQNKWAEFKYFSYTAI